MLTVVRLRSALAYDAATGTFTWRRRDDMGTAWNTRHAGKVAGYVGAEGYRLITIDDVEYRANRLAWACEHGRWPAHLIDHRNLVKGADAIENLREATPSQNKANSAIYKNNTSGFKGVSAYRGGFKAYLRKDGKYRHLGVFRTAEQAGAAYLAAAADVFGEFARAA